jgi:hypothetical protein
MRTRSHPSHEVVQTCLELQFKADIDENNIWLAASLAYFFSVVYVILTAQLEVYVEGFYC